MEESRPDHQTTAPRKRRFPFSATFASLRHRNYRLFFFGQMISLPGTWMQWTAQGYLVYDLALRHHPEYAKVILGLFGTIATLPMAILPPFGGYVADRFPRRSILLVTQSISIIMPLILAALVLLDVVRIWHVAVLAGMLAVVFSFDMPARQAFVVDLVGKDDLPNAIGLNSGVFNSARVVGPAVAGIVMAVVSIGYCFLINGISYIAVVIALFMIRLPGVERRLQSGSLFRRLAAGFSYVRKERRVFGLMALLTIIGVFGFSYTRILPAFARDIFNVKDVGFAQLLTFNGFGAIVGSLIVASLAGRGNKKHLLFVGGFIFCVGLAAFSFAGNFTTALVFMPFVGTGLIMFFVTANTLVQSVVPD
ncbi:MAG: MFS transporter, partial [Deltaproteobacteria bacterium]|nr:MFS transporter [Deltaproteobacteria bacterium]